MADADLVHDAPPGHSIAAHRALGFCSACPDRELWEETHAWRVRENVHIGRAGLPDRVPHPSREAEAHHGRR
ncbi:hypothetical protein [Streptomyces cyaneofuscatus]|uniref:hypothetical protein n=1 Tax=Streptomyces cyaneofuscatus TaxID=66883 RepID=UPI0036DE5486